MDLLGKIVCNHIVGDPPQAFVSTSCPRCLGKNVYGDISFDDAGRINTIDNFSQLKQQIEKILTENKRDTGYGFDFSLLQGVIDNGRILVIQREIGRILNYYISNQQNEKGTGFYYRALEEVSSIESIRVYQNTQEPRQVIVLINLVTVSNESKSISISLKR